jgi:hypothetical protein
VALKVGSVMMLTYAFGQSSVWPEGLYPVLITITDNMADFVSHYIGYSTTLKCAANYDITDMWGRVDCVLNTLFGGIFDPNLLLAGLIGFLYSCLFSGGIGLFIAVFGFAVIYFLMMAIFRAVYITITAYVALALMAIISPIFITMILFKSTYGYFEKWLKLTMGFMLQPMFLFAYLSMLLIAFDTVIYDGPYSLYRAIVGNKVLESSNGLPAYPKDASANPTGEFLIGQWLYDTGVYQTASKSPLGVSANPGKDTVTAYQESGVLAGAVGKPAADESFHMKTAAGIGLSVLNSFEKFDIFKVEMPHKEISWQQLAFIYYDMRYQDLIDQYCPDGCDEEAQKALDSAINNMVLNYLFQLLLSLFISLMTIYLFCIMLDALPFIGAGISGEKNSMPVLGGSGGMSMPGNKAFDAIKSSFGSLVGGK